MAKATNTFSNVFGQCECILIYEYHKDHPEKTYKELAIWAKRQFEIKKKVYPFQIHNIVIQVGKLEKPKKIEKDKASIEEIIDILKDDKYAWRKEKAKEIKRRDAKYRENDDSVC